MCWLQAREDTLQKCVIQSEKNVDARRRVGFNSLRRQAAAAKIPN
jgi:hypothetical protein